MISGNVPQTLLIRGIGPGLTAYGVTGALADPVLTVYNQVGGAAIVSNDNWSSNAAAAAVTAATSAQVGAFALTTGSLDSALVVTLPPGAYTAEVVGNGGTTGVALVEVYLVP